MNTEKSISDPFLIQIVKDRKENDDIANIISSIQERQYKIITKPLNANFVVQGCAGSGKTMVMLHRISHILYNYPKLSPKSITILTPNDNFNTYISNLNTELGINEINIFSIYEYYKHILSEYGIEISKKIKINPKEINPEIIERLYSSEMYAIYDSKFNKMKFDLEAKLNRNEIKSILEKLNLPLFDIKFNVFDEFNKYKNQVKNNIEELFNEYKSHVDVIESSLELKLEAYFMNSLKFNLKYYIDHGIEYNKVLKSLNIIDNADMLDLELNINNLLNLVKEDSDGLVGYLNNKYNLLLKYIKKSSDKTKTESSIETLRGNSKKIRKLIKFYQSAKYVSSNPGISIDEYKLFMRELESIDILNDTQFYQSLTTEQSLDGCGINLNKNITFEYQVWLKLVSTYIYFGHKDMFSQSLICIDEVQDLSIFEIEFIRKIFGEQCSLNLYGDEKQNINNKGNYQLKNLINDNNLYLLNENYRNTYDITLYTNNQLSLNMIPIGVRGPLVYEIDMCEKQWVEDLTLIIKDKFIKNHKKIIIAKDEEEVKSIQDKLITIENFSEFNFFTVREIKGMEYNTVIVFKQNMDDNELYISYTRSLNELIIIG
jgi:DNA helicase IV